MPSSKNRGEKKRTIDVGQLGRHSSVLCWKKMLRHGSRNFLPAGPHYVKINNVLSDVLFSNTGGPHGSVLSPIPYSLYTNDYRSQRTSTTIVKFADDSSMIGVINSDEEDYFTEVSKFLERRHLNFLKVNLSKTEEMIFYFRR